MKQWSYLFGSSSAFITSSVGCDLLHTSRSGRTVYSVQLVNDTDPQAAKSKATIYCMSALKHHH